MIRELFTEYARRFGWTAEQQVVVLCQYLDNDPPTTQAGFVQFLNKHGESKERISDDLHAFIESLQAESRCFCDINTAQRELNGISTEIRGGATSFCIGTRWFNWNKLYQELQALAKRYGSNKPVKDLL